MSLGVTRKNQSLFIPSGEFYLDAKQKVGITVTSHAHADHVTLNATEMICTPETAAILRARYNVDEERVSPLPYGAERRIGDATVTLHPAGHCLGSAVIRVETPQNTVLYTGDFKRASDPTCEAFRDVKCDVLLTECTFPLPIYNWPETQKEKERILRWHRQNQRFGAASILIGYSLGKAQRLIKLLQNDTKIQCHGSVHEMNEVYRAQGIELRAEKQRLDTFLKEPLEHIYIGPQGILEAKTLQKSTTARIGFASGWMQVRGNKAWKNVDAGFVLSDHADWNALLKTIQRSSCDTIIPLHGDTETFGAYLRREGYNVVHL